MTVVIVAGLAARGPGTTLLAVLLTGLFALVNSLFNLQAELLRSAGRSYLEASFQVLAGFTQLVVGIVVVVAGGSLVALLAVLVAKEVVAVTAAHLSLPAPWRTRTEPALWRTFLRQGLWLGAASTVMAVLWRYAQVVLANVGDADEVAYYSVAARYFDLSIMISVTAGIGLLPYLSSRASTERARDPFVPKMFLAAASAGLLVAAVSYAVVPSVTELLFGDRYADAASSARVITSGFPVLVVLQLATVVLVARKRERLVTRAALAGAAAAVISLPLLFARPTALTAATITQVALLVTGVCLLNFVRTTAHKEAEGLQIGHP
jgi:O-antigen/teichoic acid export membrane protein